MILQALARYYDRLKAAGKVPAFGFQNDTMPFIIVIDQDGNFKNLLDTREGKGKERREKPCVVPRAVKRTSGISANLLWDNEQYVFGIVTEKKKEKKEKKTESKIKEMEETAQKAQEAFVARIREVFGDSPADAGVAAILKFYERGEQEMVFKHPNWKAVTEKGGNISFMLEGEQQLICERPAVVEAVGKLTTDGTVRQCLLTGNYSVVAKLHNPIKGVRNAQSTGANVVSFNLDAFLSFGKEQGENAPVGEPGEFAYVTALNYLLDRTSHQKIQVGDATTVFWSERGSQIEEWMVALIDQPKPEQIKQLRSYVDSPQDMMVVRALFKSPSTGQSPPPDDELNGFYVLGLSPNAARLAVRFWYQGTVKEVARRIAYHFSDCQIIHDDREPDQLSLFRLLVATAVQKKAENIPPNLAGDTMMAILTGSNYPTTLLGAAIRRNKAEREVTYPRAALIKAILTRRARLAGTIGQEVGMALDREFQDVGYRLGRLLAMLERAQEAANPRINATIRDRYYGAMSGRPATVLPLLMKLNGHHLAKLGSEKKRLAVNIEKEIGEIVNGFPATGVPAFLTLEEQGRFAIGYYHQRQDCFKQKEAKNDKEAQ